MIRLINLSEEGLTVELVAANGEESGSRKRLYDGEVSTQEGDASAGEIVLQPTEIKNPLNYDYEFSISDGLGAGLPSSVLMSAYESESSDDSVGCVDLSFVVRDPNEEAEVWGDYVFWESCETAPGTVNSSTNATKN